MPKSLFNLLQVTDTGLAIIISLSSLRVKSDGYELQATVQTADIAVESETDIGLWARFHFAINTEDFDSTREFYGRLGFRQGITGFPLTNTHAMARALGMFDLCQYELEKGEVLLFPGAENTTGIDLLQWRVPSNPEPPYDKLNHLGMAYATLMTSDLMSDTRYLKARAWHLSVSPTVPRATVLFSCLTPTGSTSSLRRAPSCGPPKFPSRPKSWACLISASM